MYYSLWCLKEFITSRTKVHIQKCNKIDCNFQPNVKCFIAL